MKLMDKQGKVKKAGASTARGKKKDETKVLHLGEGQSVCYGTGKDSCRQTQCCLRTFCQSGWQGLFGLQRS
jgi:hypothetical protein